VRRLTDEIRRAVFHNSALITFLREVHTTVAEAVLQSQSDSFSRRRELGAEPPRFRELSALRGRLGRGGKAYILPRSVNLCWPPVARPNL
jgi:hypothetical protein